MIMGAMAFLLIAALAFAGWWQNSHNQTQMASATSTAEPGAPTAEASKEPGADAAPPAPAAEAPAASTADPTGCTFLNGNRPKVGEKYILRCDEGEYLATGTYTVDHFVWSAFEEHPEPK
ncbi:hypothetical protein HY626_00245 [Candidatus Uhrbacteria bacterium]|nr:hypothetical protein [Candidatus Uhrbacteria bacterium]